MRSHPYLRAYMAGITVPTMFLLVVLCVLIVIRHSYAELPVPVERFAIFPMAVVPNAWGIWNVLRLATSAARPVPLGWCGALLAVVLPFFAIAVSRAIGFHPPAPPAAIIAIAWLVAILVYYLVWKYVVAFLNELLGVDG